MIKVFFNDELVELSSTSLMDFIETRDAKEGLGHAICINEKVLPKSDWASYQLDDGDKILMFKAIAGG